MGYMIIRRKFGEPIMIDDSIEILVAKGSGAKEVKICIKSHDGIKRKIDRMENGCVQESKAKAEESVQQVGTGS